MCNFILLYKEIGPFQFTCAGRFLFRTIWCMPIVVLYPVSISSYDSFKTCFFAYKAIKRISLSDLLIFPIFFNCLETVDALVWKCAESALTVLWSSTASMRSSLAIDNRGLQKGSFSNDVSPAKIFSFQRWIVCFLHFLPRMPHLYFWQSGLPNFWIEILKQILHGNHVSP